MAKCLECGKEFSGLTEFCGPCELTLQAHEPPKTLRDYQHVYEGREPVDDAQRMLRQIMVSKPSDFLAGKRAEEKGWREAVAKLKGASSPEQKPADTPAVRDEGTERALELLDRLLEEGL